MQRIWQNSGEETKQRQQQKPCSFQDIRWIFMISSEKLLSLTLFSSACSQAHSILSLLGSQTLFVADEGKLVGLITWPEVGSVFVYFHPCTDVTFNMHVFVTFPCSSNELYFVQTRPRPCMDLLKLCRALGENSYLWIQSSLICSLPPSLPPSPFSPPDEEDIRGLGQRNLSDITATSSRQHILSKFILNKHVSVSAWLAQRV